MSLQTPPERPDEQPGHPEPMTAAEALSRYRRITSHLIAESLGYLTPLMAAAAVAAHRNGESFCCEWYADMAMRQNKPVYDAQVLRDINHQILQQAVRRRHQHTGYMAEYEQARALVEQEIREGGSTGSMLASWF